MDHKNNLIQYISEPLMFQTPAAEAVVEGSEQYSGIRGEVFFYRAGEGTLLLCDISGLPVSGKKCGGGIFGFHIHEGENCTGDSQDSFAGAGSHYNPGDCPHPYHAGDLPPLFASAGRACMGVIIDRFSVEQVIGRTVVIHDKPDDFTSQPSGNAGVKIACGKIVKVSKY